MRCSKVSILHIQLIITFMALNFIHSSTMVRPNVSDQNWRTYLDIYTWIHFLTPCTMVQSGAYEKVPGGPEISVPTILLTFFSLFNTVKSHTAWISINNKMTKLINCSWLIVVALGNFWGSLKKTLHNGHCNDWQPAVLQVGDSFNSFLQALQDSWCCRPEQLVFRMPVARWQHSVYPSVVFHSRYTLPL